MVTFSKLSLDEHGKPVETDVREIAQSDMRKCPHFIMVAEHYNGDGSCRCNDVTHTKMRAWGYHWNKAMKRWE